MRFCYACRRSVEKDKVVLHRFPNDASLYLQWREFCKMFRRISTVHTSEEKFLCNRHFTSDDYKWPKHLKKEAFPSIIAEEIQCKSNPPETVCDTANNTQAESSNNETNLSSRQVVFREKLENKKQTIPDSKPLILSRKSIPKRMEFAKPTIIHKQKDMKDMKTYLPPKPHFIIKYVPSEPTYFLKMAPLKHPQDGVLKYSFDSLVKDIKNMKLPSPTWKIKVVVKSNKIASIIFTNKCVLERTVTFNAKSEFFEVVIENRPAILLGSPGVVTCIEDIEILLNIIHTISAKNDILYYKNN